MADASAPFSQPVLVSNPPVEERPDADEAAISVEDEKKELELVAEKPLDRTEPLGAASPPKPGVNLPMVPPSNGPIPPPWKTKPAGAESQGEVPKPPGFTVPPFLPPPTSILSPPPKNGLPAAPLFEASKIPFGSQAAMPEPPKFTIPPKSGAEADSPMKPVGSPLPPQSPDLMKSAVAPLPPQKPDLVKSAVAPLPPQNPDLAKPAVAPLPPQKPDLVKSAVAPPQNTDLAKPAVAPLPPQKPDLAKPAVAPLPPQKPDLAKPAMAPLPLQHQEPAANPAKASDPPQAPAGTKPQFSPPPFAQMPRPQFGPPSVQVPAKPSIPLQESSAEPAKQSPWVGATTPVRASQLQPSAKQPPEERKQSTARPSAEAVFQPPAPEVKQLSLPPLLETVRTKIALTLDGQNWACPACTLHNEIKYAQCAACMFEHKTLKKILEAVEIPFEMREPGTKERMLAAASKLKFW